MSYPSYDYGMTIKKERVTITVDAHLVEAGNKAVASGRADSLSGWINLALTERLEKERRLVAMAEAIATYEARFGQISAEEIAAQERADRQAAIVVRGPRTRGATRRRAGAKGGRGVAATSAREAV